MLKKKLAFALIFVILIAFLGYRYFIKSIPETRNVSFAESYIPDDAISLLQFNTSKLRDLVISESFKSPMKMKDLYDNLDSLKLNMEIPTKEVEFFIKSGLNLPDRFLAFEFSIDNSSFLSAIFPIKSKNKIEQVLKERNYLRVVDNQYLLQQENLGILVAGDLCFFIYSDELDKESLQSAASHLIATNTAFESSDKVSNWPDFSLKIDEQSPLISKLATLPATSITIKGNHLKGRTKFEILLEKKDSNSASFFQPTYNRLESDNAIAHLTLGLNTVDYPLMEILNKKQISDLNKSLSTIQGHVSDIDKIWEGQLEFSLSIPKETKEKFVSYEYDDNFEKVEKIQWKNSINPDFELLLSLKEGGSELMKTKSWVTDKEFIAYPLQKVYYTDNSGMAILNTEPSNNGEMTLSMAARDNPPIRAIDIAIDVQQLTEYYPLLFKKEDLEKFQKNLSRIDISDELTGFSQNITVDIEYTNPGQSGIISLMELLSHSSTVESKIESVNSENSNTKGK